MRNVVFGFVLGVGALLLGFVLVVAATQPNEAHALKNAYWPYSVETVVRDR